MFVPAHWNEVNIPLSQITLDQENYRIPPAQRISEDSMILYMFRAKGIVPLAESIVRFGGLFPQEKIICLRVGPEEYVVLEGNRRVAALKMLTRPTQFLSSDVDINRVPTITVELATELQSVPAWVVDARAVASSAVAGSHIYGQKVQWSDRAKMQFASDRMTDGAAVEDIATELAMDSNEVIEWVARNRVFENVIALPHWSDDQRDVFWHEELKLEPFFQKIFNYKIKQHFGAPLYLNDGKPNAQVQHHEHYVFVIAKHTLIAQFDKSMRRLRTSDDLTTYLRDVFGPPIIATESHKPQFRRDLFTDLELENVPEAFSVFELIEDRDEAKSSRMSDYSFFRQLNCIRKDDERFCQLCRELRGLSAYSNSSDKLLLNKYRLAFSFLIRAVLERSFWYHLMRLNLLKDFKNQMDKKRRFSVEDYLKYFSENVQMLDLDRELGDKIKAIRNDKSLINDLHWNIHNEYGTSSAERLREICISVRPVVEYFASTRSYGS